MDHDHVDHLPRAFTTGISRRQALKLLGGSLAGVLVLPHGIELARAANTLSLSRTDNAALFWNDVFLAAALADSQKAASQQEQAGPTRTSRAAAIVHAALHNAVNGVRQRCAFYQDPATQRPARPGPPPSGASQEAAGAGAAYHALCALYPSQKASVFDPALARFRALPLPGANHQPSIQFGSTVAQALLDARADDGAQRPDPAYTAPAAVGIWQPDPILAPPGPPLGVGWGRIRPFLIQSASTQFAVPAPPAVTSGDYAFAFREVYNKGRNTSPAPPLGRTVDEQDIGLFWSYDYKRGTPIRLYNQHAVQILSQEPEVPQVASPLHHHARMLALINLAMADAGIACWESKYRYNYWRPFQGIRLVDGAGNPLRDAAGNPIRDDGNPNTTHDRTWLPLGGPGGPRPNVTPNFPAYVSGHSSFGAAMFGMLRKFFGTKPFPFTLTSEEVANVRRYADRRDPATNAIITSWTQAIDENSASRIYLGVHWRRDYTRGTPLGQQVADFIWPSFLRPTT